MAQEFKETAHLNTDKEKYDEGYDRIFGKKDKKGNKVKEPERRIYDKLNNKIIAYDPFFTLETYQVFQVQDKGGNWHDE